MNIKMNKKGLLFCFFVLFGGVVAFSKEFTVEDIDRLLSDKVLYSDVSFWGKEEYQAFHEWLTPYYWEKTPEGFDEKAMKVVTSFDVRKAALEDRINPFLIEERGSIFAVMLFANQSFRDKTEGHLRVAEYLNGVSQIKFEEYKSNDPNRFRRRDAVENINQSIRDYRRSLIHVTAHRLRDLKRKMEREQFDSFTNNYAKTAKLSEAEMIVLIDLLVPRKESTEMRKALQNRSGVRPH